MVFEVGARQRQRRLRHQRLLRLMWPGMKAVRELTVGARVPNALVAQPPIRGRVFRQFRPRYKPHQLRLLPLQNLKHAVQDRA